MLGTYLQISLGVSVVILLNLLFKYLFNKHYASGLSYAVWILCAVMLLIPYKPEAQIKIDMPQIEEYKASIVTSTKNTNTENITAEDNTSLDLHDSAKSVTMPMSSKHNIPDLLTVIRIIWGLGTLIFMLYHIIGYVIFYRRIKPWCRTISIEGYNGKPSLTECRVIKSPMLVGFFRSRIILPRYDYTENELNMILKHELTHYKRGDLWFKMLFIVANAIHWFNPFVYILRHAANRDMEYSCDEKVVKNEDINFRRNYSMTILRCASGGIKTTFSTYFMRIRKILNSGFQIF